MEGTHTYTYDFTYVYVIYIPASAIVENGYSGMTLWSWLSISWMAGLVATVAWGNLAAPSMVSGGLATGSDFPRRKECAGEV